MTNTSILIAAAISLLAILWAAIPCIKYAIHKRSEERREERCSRREVEEEERAREQRFAHQIALIEARQRAEAAAVARYQRSAGCDAVRTAREKSKAVAQKRNVQRSKAKPTANPAVSASERRATVSVASAPRKGGNAFVGQVVAFTGRLPGMTHREAVQAVQKNGGRAFERGMPKDTTILVVGDKSGMGKMDKADRWIGQVRKITPAQFMKMIA